MASESQIKAVFGMLSAAYPQAGVTAATLAVYVRTLADLDPQILDAAAADCISRLKFFPTVAEIREAAAQVASLRFGPPSPGEAWAEVVSAIREVGSWGSPSWSHPRIGEAVRQVGGWRNLCLSENQAADRARFLEIYAEASRREAYDAVTLPEVKDLALRLAGKATSALPPPEGKGKREESHG